MTNTIASEKDDNTIIIKSEPEIWEIKSTKHLIKFWRWTQKKQLLPGDIVPKRIWKKYYILK